MIILESLERHRTDKEVVILHFDGAEDLRVSVDFAAGKALCSGAEFSEDEYARLRSEAGADRARLRAARMISRRPMSERELVRKLMEKGESEEDAQAAADYLTELRVLDDSEYAATLVRYYGSRGYGAGRIKSEFRRRGIPSHLWSGALSELGSQEDEILKFLQKKLGDEWDRKEQQRAAAALARRGHSWDDINSALRKLRGYDE